MNIWADAVITLKGLALQTKLMAGHTLAITRAESGAGTVPAVSLQNQTAVSEPKQALSFKPIVYPKMGKCKLPVLMGNEGLQTGYVCNQIGIYATDPDEGEILYFIAQADKAAGGLQIPANAEMSSFSAQWDFYFQFGQADGVTVVTDPVATVTFEDLQNALKYKPDAKLITVNNGAAGFEIAPGAWSKTNTYPDYPYSCTMSAYGGASFSDLITTADLLTVIFSAKDCASGILAPVCCSNAGSFTVYAAEVPESNVMIHAIRVERPYSQNISAT